ncbi:PP2C family protein-serine/threonine phosphatase, partial [Streptomyces sp. SM14]|uniref:PP2C family protein-serine/threonine phosphatase n=2 Tax=unclassified Streptomyces TaxID=2593676 RepID=UPI0011B0AB58
PVADNRPRPDPGVLTASPGRRRDLPATELRLLNQGHPPPLVLTADGAVQPIVPGDPALPLGLAALGGRQVEPSTVLLAPGSVLLMYTDGLSEARDARGRFYDPEVRLRGCPERDPDRLLDWIIEDVTRHGGIGNDDLALMAVSATVMPQDFADDLGDDLAEPRPPDVAAPEPPAR